MQAASHLRKEVAIPPDIPIIYAVKLRFWPCDLRLTHRWTIASRQGADHDRVVIVELTDDEGLTGLGEAAPSSTYGESPESAMAFLRKVNAADLSFDDLRGSTAYLDTVAPGELAARCGLNVALADGASKRAGKPLCEFLGLGFREGRHLTSFSIGIDSPGMIRQKTLAATDYPILKLKVGAARDGENLAALREVAPAKPVRVDANEAWATREEALERIEWLAKDGGIQFVEQPMPAGSEPKDLAWLKGRSPLPIFADESYHDARDAAKCAECFHGVNVKLVKTGGVTAAQEALAAARAAGLKTMIGCMIETSILITAGAHLAELADYLDLDGNLLITNDPYVGVSADGGVLSFARAPGQVGLRVAARAEDEG